LDLTYPPVRCARRSTLPQGPLLASSIARKSSIGLARNDRSHLSCPKAELTGTTRRSSVKVANKPTMALGVMPIRRSGIGLPSKTRNTTTVAMKQARLPSQLSSWYFQEKMNHLDCEFLEDDKSCSESVGGNTECWEGLSKGRWCSAGVLRKSSSCAGDCISASWNCAPKHARPQCCFSQRTKSTRKRRLY
jgi:hypothetical protein